MNKILTKQFILNHEETIAYFTRIYNESGEKENCEKKIEYYYKLAFDAMDEVSTNENTKLILIDYVKELMGRDR